MIPLMTHVIRQSLLLAMALEAKGYDPSATRVRAGESRFAAADEAEGKSRFIVNELKRLDKREPGDESASTINLYAWRRDGICSCLPRILAGIPLRASGEPWITQAGKDTRPCSRQRRSDRTDLPGASSNKATGDCPNVSPTR